MQTNSSTERNLLDAMPPNDLETEQALLGAMLMRPEVIDDVTRGLMAKDFYDPMHAVLYRTLIEMHQANQRIDTRLLVSALKKRGHWNSPKKEGWTADMLADVLTSCPTAANAPVYARTVRDYAVRRELLSASLTMVRLAHDQGREGQDLVNEAETEIMAIRDARTMVDQEPVSIAEVLQDALLSINTRRGGQTSGGLKTGFPDLDAIRGLHPGELTILAARPGMGKTALALNIASHVAVEELKTVLFVSIEMSSLLLADRLLSAWADVRHYNMAKGMLTNGERQALIAACAKLAESRLYIEVPHHCQVRDIAASCRRLKRQQGLGLLVVDYLQLVTPDYTRDSREQQVAKISAGLKQLSRELNIPVLCLSQLNRAVETSTDKTPRLSHLRESGSIEQDADVVAFVHREEMFNPSPEHKGKAQLIVAKNRNGQTGNVSLVWDGEYVRFKSMAKAEQLRDAGYEPGFDKFNRGEDDVQVSEELEPETDGDWEQRQLPAFGEGNYGG